MRGRVVREERGRVAAAAAAAAAAARARGRGRDAAGRVGVGVAQLGAPQLEQLVVVPPERVRRARPARPELDRERVP